MSEKEKEKKKKLLVELLSKTPIVETACQKVGISRMMFYRWKKEDNEFVEIIEETLSVSRERINDLAESQIIKKIKDGHFSACTFFLRNNCKRYQPKKPVAAGKSYGSRGGYHITIIEERGIYNINDLRDLKQKTREKIEMILGDYFLEE
jgi:hypothetical protein